MRIDGLTRRQAQICDLLWECDSMSEVQNVLDALPEFEREQAHTLMLIMTQEAMEKELSLMERYPDAEEMLETLKKNYF